MNKILSLIIFLSLFTGNAFSQADPITGTVLDKDGFPIISATVEEVGAQNYTTTDFDGNFSLRAKNELPTTFKISAVGFKTQSIQLYEISEDAVTIVLKSDNLLDEVVIIGYGSQKKGNLVGSVIKVDPTDVKVIPEGGFDAQLQGKASGVQINSNTGVPGSNVFIRVRGTTSINASNDPLYIVDGVFVNSASLQNIAQDRGTSPLADINPSDIESIEILKDAAAVAIYGSRGANGVVIVTTKRGDFDQKPKIQFNTTYGSAWAPKDRIWKTTTGPEHAMLVDEYRANQGLPLRFTPVSQGGRGLPEEQPTYDRMSLLNRTAALKTYDLSVSGGSKSTRYYIGGGYTDQESIWRPMDFRRGSFKLNLDQKINDKITIGTSNSISRTDRDQARPANGGNGTLLQASLNIPTYLPIFLEDGTPAKWVNFDNIYQLVNTVNVWSQSSHYIGNLYVDADLLPGLKFRSSWSVDYNIYEENEFWDNRFLLGAAPTNGRATTSLTRASSWINEQTLRYSTNINGNHNVGILVGNTVQSATVSNLSATGTNFPSNSFSQLSAAANQTVSEFWTKNSLTSFFSRAEYDYRNKYFLEAIIRADGSSKFSKQNRWGYFPAVGAAWKISEESFLRNSKYISNLKLRANYGETGNQNGINDFAARGLWVPGEGYPDASGGLENPGIRPQQLANPDLLWERTSQFNLGVDLGLFDNRVNVEFNVYNKYTTDVLLEVAVPSSTGFSTYLSNFGEISNKGFELSINSDNIVKDNFSWSTNFNISQNKNTVEKIPNPIPFGGRDLIRVEEGYPLYSYWLYNQLEVNPQTGDVVFEDVNGDGQITADDRRILQSTWPKFFGGLTNTFKYKNFDFNVFFTFSYGNYVWNHNKMLGETGGTLDANRVLLASQLDRWQKPGDITSVPRLTSDNYAIQQNSRFFEDGSFIRLRSLSIGYRFPESLASNLRIDKARVYLTASNLLLFTKYTGADPETNLEGNQNIQGYDYALPPQPRSFQLGFDITL